MIDPEVPPVEPAAAAAAAAFPQKAPFGPEVFLPGLWFPVTTVVVYGLTLKLMQMALKNRRPPDVKWPLFVHNLLLCAISVVMVAGFSYEAVRVAVGFGGLAVYCGTGDDYEDAGMLVWALVFYYSKYYELVDTLFLALRNRELTVLHVFHHMLLILAGYVQVVHAMYFGWVTAWINALVHVFMYYYFAVMSLGRTIWWKEWLTYMQIVQFFVDISSSLPWIVFYLAGVPCRGTLFAWCVANFGGVSLIFLFSDFYRKTYPAKPKPKTT